MPLLKGKALQKVVEPVNDNDEVFVCATTGEFFRNYDDFFSRIMLLSSTAWSWEKTGRNNLTYKGALEKQRSTKRSFKTIPTALKGPILLIASHTKRTRIHELAGDVYGYAKDVFFKGETVYTKTGDPKTIRKAKIVRAEISGSPSDHNPSRLIYHVESLDEGTQANYSVQGEAIIRERNSLSREKCKLFLKQHVELRANQMLCVKKESLEKFATSTGCTNDKVFYGQRPEFEVSKQLQAPAHPGKDAGKPVKNQKIAFQMTGKDHKEKLPSNKKQQSMEKYLKQSANDSAAKKEVMLEKKKKQPEELAKQKALQAEKDRLRKQVGLALKEYSGIKEDLELTDQRVLPPAREVRTLIGEEYFPDFVFILEFLYTFSDLLSIKTNFPNGVTMELLESALLLRELDGPLSGILQVLLRTIFAALKDLKTSEEANLDPGTTKVIKWCTKNLSTKLTDLPMDSTTVSELLRMYISAYNKPAYFGDACYILIREHPDIMQTLATHTVFDLPTKSVIAVISALIHQLLVTDEVLSRLEMVEDARNEFKIYHQEQCRLTVKTKALKKAAEKKFKKTSAFERRRELDDEKLNNELAQIEADAALEMKKNQKHIEALNRNYNLYQVHLGRDRGFRNYWQFQSIPGLFVEHDTKSIRGCCLERMTVQIPALAQSTGENRRKYITESILKCVGNEKEGDTFEELLLRGSALLEQSNKPKQDTFVMDKGNPVEANNALVTHPTNRELFMCTGDGENCPVHHPALPSNLHAKWSYYATRQELDTLIKSLNERGRREHALREALIFYRDIIAGRIDLCPTEKLSIEENNRTIMLAGNQNNEKSEPALAQSILLETKFRKSLLKLEGRITAGCMGKLKVNSIQRWRDAILKRSYDPQIDLLEWGHNECMITNERKPNKQSSSEESEEEDFHVLPEVERVNEATQNQDPLHDFLPDTVCSMASALLQVKQSIDINFFRHPFGPSQGTCKLVRWESSLMRATSFSQLFLHYHVLYDAIEWFKSERAVCMVCNLRGNPSVSLVCDECYRVFHRYCLKPRLMKKPEGDWFCMRCRPEDHILKSTELPRRPLNKRNRESDPKKEGYAKKSKLWESSDSPSGERRSLRLMAKEA